MLFMSYVIFLQPLRNNSLNAFKVIKWGCINRIKSNVLSGFTLIILKPVTCGIDGANGPSVALIMRRCYYFELTIFNLYIIINCVGKGTGAVANEVCEFILRKDRLLNLLHSMNFLYKDG